MEASFSSFSSFSFLFFLFLFRCYTDTRLPLCKVFIYGFDGPPPPGLFLFEDLCGLQFVAESLVRDKDGG